MFWIQLFGFTNNLRGIGAVALGLGLSHSSATHLSLASLPSSMTVWNTIPGFGKNTKLYFLFLFSPLVLRLLNCIFCFKIVDNFSNCSASAEFRNVK